MRFPLKLLTFSVMVLFVAGCLDSSQDAGQSGSEAGTDVAAIPYMSNIQQPTNVICDALSSSTTVSTDPTAGLVANLYYLDSTQPRYTTVDDNINYGHPVTDASLYFNQVNIPTRPFDQGFTTNAGQTLTDMDGNTLYEYFSLEFMSDIVLGPNDPEGDYQFALLSDDGSYLAYRADDGTPLDKIVDDDGTHPTQMGCASTPVTMSSSTRVPITYRYFQGPRYYIAAMILWRPWPSDPSMVDDVQCGQLGNSMYFSSPTTPQPTFTDMLARGWLVLSPSNYKVPQGIENSCNVPAPTVSNEEESEVSAIDATFTWTTDIPSTSQLQYTNTSTGQNSVSTIDTLLVTSHSVNITGLTASTLYNVTPVSSSASGKSGSGQQITFRTRSH